jgi:hypothetical protein
MSGDDIQDQLAKLPLRAIVAFAVRCARRVQPLGRVLTEYRQVEVDDAIAIAEGFARGGKADRAAGAAWDTGRAASRPAARGDLHQLLALELGRPGTLGKPIDPAEDGPLGPLWPNAAPDWYTNPPKLSDESNPPTASLDD